jgi:hypothetical protein
MSLSRFFSHRSFDVLEQLNNPDFKPVEFDGFKRSPQSERLLKLNALAISQMKVLLKSISLGAISAP